MIRRGAALFALALIGLAGGALAEPRPFAAPDLAAIRAALDAARANDAAAILAQRDRAADPAARALIGWLAFSRKDTRASFADMAAFLRAYPDWPLADTIAANAESALDAKAPAEAVLGFVAARPLRTARAAGAAAQALIEARRPAEARALLQRVWTQSRLSDAEENEWLGRHAAMLGAEDHYARIGMLLSRGDKAAAQRLIGLAKLPPGLDAAAKARLAMRETGKADRAPVDAAIAAVPAELRREPGFAYDLARWHRRHGRVAEATAALNGVPAPAARPESYWKEQDILIRQAIERRDVDAAYRIAASHRQAGAHAAEAHFLAGFIALRLLKNAGAAETHFSAGAAAAKDGPEIARLAYWRGRAAEVLGRRDQAQLHYGMAAGHANAFYGQLAATRLGSSALRFVSPGAPPPDSPFWSNEMVRGAAALAQLGDAPRARLLGVRAAYAVGKSAGEQAWLARFVLRVTGPGAAEVTALRLRRLATRAGAAGMDYGYPVIDLPAANTAEPALVFALILQESEFQVAARSPAGALGLMQLMPFTAQKEAQELKLAYAPARLTADAAYNLRLGTQHLLRLHAQYDGAYPLMLAAYNAGAHRVDRWLAAHGDPRKGGGVEWIDWIELIPFEETREYVKLVLAAHTIYRLRLGDTVNLARLDSHWIAPKPDAAACAPRAPEPVVPVANAAPPVASAPEVPLALGHFGASPELAPFRLRHAARPEAAKPGDIAMLRKEKPDNRPGAPLCRSG